MPRRNLVPGLKVHVNVEHFRKKYGQGHEKVSLAPACGVLLEKPSGARKWPIKLDASGDVELVFFRHLEFENPGGRRKGPTKRKVSLADTMAGQKSALCRDTRHELHSSDGIDDIAAAATTVSAEHFSCPSDDESDRPPLSMLSLPAERLKEAVPGYHTVPPLDGYTGRFTLKLDESPPSEEIIVSEGVYKGLRWACNDPQIVETYPPPKSFLGPIIDSEAGPTVRLQYDAPPIDFFNLFSPPYFLRDVVVKQSNLYARQQGFGITKYPEFKTLKLRDINNYFAVLMYNGIKPAPRICGNWSADKAQYSASISSLMSCRRFKEVAASFHLADNSKMPGRGDIEHDFLYKVRPALESFRSTLPKYWDPGQYLSVDETTRHIGGRCESRIKANCRRFKDEGDGIQFECISDRGYALDFEWRHDPNIFRPAYAETELRQLSPTSQRVCFLLNRVTNRYHGGAFVNHHVYLDNLYSSVALFRYALKIGYTMTGTCRSNRGCPSYINQTKLQKPPAPKLASVRGRVRFAHLTDIPMMACTIYDTAPVRFLSTGHLRCDGFYKDRGTFLKPLPKLNLQDCYNKRMNGVDRFDQLWQHFRVDRGRSRRWWVGVALWALIDGPAAQAYTVYKHICKRANQHPMERIDFQSALASSMADKGRVAGPLAGSVGRASDRNLPRRQSPLKMHNLPQCRFSVRYHHIIFDAPSTTCQLCSLHGIHQRTTLRCGSCNVGLCKKCFNPFHEQKKPKCTQKRKKRYVP